jgi:VID27 C-terminal WD40-like domain
MRMAKTAFPGLGSPITHVDVTYDGKWILGTTDTYLVLICTIFIDKDGKEKTGFTGRMGNRIAAPRLLKLTPLDSHLAGVDNKFRGGQFSWVHVHLFYLFINFGSFYILSFCCFYMKCFIFEKILMFYYFSLELQSIVHLPYRPTMLPCHLSLSLSLSQASLVDADNFYLYMVR